MKYFDIDIRKGNYWLPSNLFHVASGESTWGGKTEVNNSRKFIDNNVDESNRSSVYF